MSFTFRDLWRVNGTIARGPYALVGLIGFAIKHNLDRVVATAVFQRKWGLFNYWIPLDEAVRFTSLPRHEALFLATMVVLAIPFILIGVALTVRRLRDASLPAWLVALFFLPVLNLLFFAFLCVIPSRTAADSFERPPRGALGAFLARLIPKSAIGSAAMAIALTLTFGLAAAVLGTAILRNYGWGLFVALPFCLGLASALLYGYHQPRSYWSCVLVSCLSTLLVAAGLMAVAIEGAVCLMMAVPLGWMLAVMGGTIGYAIQRQYWTRVEAPAMLSVILLFVPAFYGLEGVAGPAPPVYDVRTSLEIEAPPEIVWKQVVAFSELPPPTETLFRMGIAYPIRAEIQGRGPGAERHCVFSTGAFIEPIEIWDEPRLLKFSVTANPTPMQEWTPFADVQPPHLHGYLVSTGGQFRLTPLPGGRTLLEGTTWYRHSMWPAAYWRLWSDSIIHTIHLRVLRHIAHLSEASAPAGLNQGTSGGIP